MKILLAHNHYGAYAQGGEATVFNQERDLLRAYGNEVKTFEKTNDDLKSRSFFYKFSLVSLGRAKDIYEETTKVIKFFRPDVLHVHNYKYVFTSSIFEAAHDQGVPVVLSVHNYRLICPGGQLRRGERICEECLHKNPIRSLWRSGCASSYGARVLQYLFYCRTHDSILNNVDAFIIPTDFGKQRFLEAGFPPDKLFVKPYFLFDFKKISSSPQENLGALFIGRLSEEKGIRVLIKAWKEIDYPLTVIGSGPEEDWARRHAPKSVRFLGSKSHRETLELLSKADFLVFPSVCHEGLGMTLIEACVLGVPVIASDLGGRREIIKDGCTGSLFESGSCSALADVARRFIANPEMRAEFGRAARKQYETLYTPERNYRELHAIYDFVTSKK